MILIKNSLSFVLAFALIFSLQAENPSVTIGQEPPFIIHSSDTSEAIFPKLKNGILPDTTFETVEDTLLPPCDVIFFKSGKLEYCKIIETAPTTITYKMCDYQDGPNVVINKSDVHKIRYANGKEEVIIPSSQQGQLNAYVKARKDPMSTWALIASLGGLLFIPAAIAGVVLGIVSLNRIRKSEGRLRGKGTARAAIIVGGIILLLTILLYI
jgi:hypothetical protein